MAPRSFEGLSYELQLSTLDLLSFDDLARLSRVNKSLRSLTESRLYATIQLSWAREHKPPLVPLLRSILRRPERGHAVRSLCLHGAGFQETLNRADLEPPALPVSGLPMTEISEHIRSTGVPHAKEWTREVQDGAVDAILALLVSMLPRLESLHLGSIFAIRNFWLGELLRCSLTIDFRKEDTQLPKFRYLSRVAVAPRLHEPRHRDANNTADVLPFFGLPAIERLSVSMDNPKTWPFEPSPTNLTSLELYRLRETRLDTLLAPLVSLRSLHWHCDYQANLDSHASKPIIDLNAVAEALRFVSKTLADLTIEAESTPDVLVGEYEPPEFQVRGSLQGMKCLENIKSLCLPWVFLMGSSPETSAENAVGLAEILPRGMEVLKLTGDLMNHEDDYWHDEIVIKSIKTGLKNEETEKMLAKLVRIILPIPFGRHVSEQVRAEMDDFSSKSGVILESDDDFT